MSIKWLWGKVSNRRQYRRQCRRQSFHLLCVYNEVLGPLAMRQSHHSFYLLVFQSTATQVIVYASGEDRNSRMAMDYMKNKAKMDEVCNN